MTMLPPDPVYIFKGEMKAVTCLTSKKINNRDFMFAGTVQGLIHVWDLETKREVVHFESSKDGCISIHFYDETSDLITQDRMGVIRFWLETDLKWEVVTDITTNFHGFCQCVLFSDSLYVPIKNGCIQSISVKTKTKADSFSFVEKDKVNEITCFKIFSFNGETLILIAFETCDISLFTLQEQKALSQIKVDECPMALAFNSAIMIGVCGCPTEKILVFSINKKLEIVLKHNIIMRNPGVASLSIRADSRILAVGCWDNKLRLYSMKRYTILAVLDIHSGTVQDVHFMNIGNENNKFYLAAASKDGKVSLWDLYN